MGQDGTRILKRGNGKGGEGQGKRRGQIGGKSNRHPLVVSGDFSLAKNESGMYIISVITEITNAVKTKGTI
jgi:hypothetical protein